MEKKTNIPVSEQTLYCQEIPLPEGKLLVECQGMDNGVALCLVRKPFIIKVYRPDSKVNVRVEIPKSELNSWTISILCKYISNKVGFQEYYDHILANDGTIIKTDISELKLNEYFVITNRYTMTVTFFKKSTLKDHIMISIERSLYVPALSS